MSREVFGSCPGLGRCGREASYSSSSNQVEGLLKSAQEDFLEEVGAVQRGADSKKNCHHFPHLSAQLCSAAVRSLSPAEHDLTTNKIGPYLRVTG